MNCKHAMEPMNGRFWCIKHERWFEVNGMACSICKKTKGSAYTHFQYRQWKAEQRQEGSEKR